LAARLRKGSRLGKYVLVRRLGQGGFAEVWNARDTVEGLPVALKIADPDVASGFSRADVEREARIAVRLRHPNIVAVRNADWIDGQFAIASELALTSLARFTRARRSPTVGLSIIRQIASGLAHAHSRRVMHRDVKPENILIFAGDRAALGDFGASTFARRVDKTYSEVGTLGYMAPEQAYGRPAYTSDVFSLGLIAYELLSGKLLRWPFTWPPEGFKRFESRVPPEVIPVLRKAVQFQPGRRYRDAGELHHALEAALRKAATPPPRPRRRSGKPAHAPEVSPLEVAGKLFQKRHRKGLGLHIHCYRCEGPLSEEMLTCPWCGADHQSFQKTTSYPMVCPWCEHGVRPEWKFCPWCYQGRFVSNGRQPPPDPKAERACTRKGCRGELRPFMRYCPMCKQKPKRSWKHAELSEKCPRCRWPVSREFFRFCPWCGRHEPRAGTFRSGRASG